MKTPPTGLQWMAVAACWALATAMITSPQRLPGPLRTGIEKAVDGVAVGCLWLWGKPVELPGTSDGTASHSSLDR